MIKVEGQKWYYTEGEEGVYLHLEKDGGSLAISIGHPDDTIRDFNEALVKFFYEIQESKVKPSCSICGALDVSCVCQGCRKYFCGQHFLEHQQANMSAALQS